MSRGESESFILQDRPVLLMFHKVDLYLFMLREADFSLLLRGGSLGNHHHPMIFIFVLEMLCLEEFIAWITSLS